MNNEKRLYNIWGCMKQRCNEPPLAGAETGGEEVKIMIIGKPKEIAALAAETQERQFQQMLTVQGHYRTERFDAMCRSIELLRDSRRETSDQEIQSCE